jgi:putative ATP-dependent endonuclease of the OLD family
LKLKTLILKNFRGYKDEVRINCDDLTTFIGKNDSGKSTILEALDIFFNKDKIELEDACVYRTDDNVLIGCIFSDLPNSLTIDSSALTSLKEENLLNENGLLEIHKIYKATSKNPKENIFAYCQHPDDEKSKDLLQFSQAELKKIVKELNIPDDEVNKTSNVSMRNCIRLHSESKKLVSTLIPLNKADAKKVWDKLKEQLPIYSLFKADRPSNDEDAEVQDPMKVAIQNALSGLEKELNIIKEQVQKDTLDVAKRTLEKVKELDVELGQELSPKFKTEPKWDGLFKLSLSGDGEIPINKRGSGVRRLILLSFFRAEAERLQQESSVSRNIIYAVEEPETAQHPNNQKKIIESLIEISGSLNSQVIITTHSPSLAGLIPIEDLRFINNNKELQKVGQSLASDEFVPKIINTLGLIPNIDKYNTDEIRAIICLEGKHDIQFLKYVSKVIHEFDNTYLNLERDPNVILIHLGGSSLQDWVDNHYLGKLNIPEFHIYDRDNPEKPKYQSSCDQVNNRGDGSWASLTNKREMENYIHPKAIQEVYGFPIEFDDWTDVPTLVARLTHTNGSEIPWEELSADKMSKKEKKAKSRLNSDVLQHLTYERIIEMDTDKEIFNWLKKIEEIIIQPVK